MFIFIFLKASNRRKENSDIKKYFTAV